MSNTKKVLVRSSKCLVSSLVDDDDIHFEGGVGLDKERKHERVDDDDDDDIHLEGGVGLDKEGEHERVEGEEV